MFNKKEKKRIEMLEQDLSFWTRMYVDESKDHERIEKELKAEIKKLTRAYPRYKFSVIGEVKSPKKGEEKQRKLDVSIVTGDPVTICVIKNVGINYVGFSVRKHGDVWDLKTAVTLAVKSTISQNGNDLFSEVDKKEIGKEVGKIVEKISATKTTSDLYERFKVLYREFAAKNHVKVFFGDEERDRFDSLRYVTGFRSGKSKIAEEYAKIARDHGIKVFVAKPSWK